MPGKSAYESSYENIVDDDMATTKLRGFVIGSTDDSGCKSKPTAL